MNDLPKRNEIVEFFYDEIQKSSTNQNQKTRGEAEERVRDTMNDVINIFVWSTSCNLTAHYEFFCSLKKKDREILFRNIEESYRKIQHNITNLQEQIPHITSKLSTKIELIVTTILEKWEERAMMLIGKQFRNTPQNSFQEVIYFFFFKINELQLLNFFGLRKI